MCRCLNIASAGPRIARVLGALPLLAVVVLIGYLVLTAAPGASTVSFTALLGTRWQPDQGHWGLLGLTAGTLTTALLATGLIVPLSLAVAYYLTQCATPTEARRLQALLAAAAGIPSVVVGLLVMLWLVPRLGATLAAAALTLAAMLWPALTLQTVAALHAASADDWQSARALGVSDGPILRRMVWPKARRALAGAVLLTLGRGMGEAVAVSMVIGNAATWPLRLQASAQTLTTVLVQEIEGATALHFQLLHLAALVNVALIATVVIAGRQLLEVRDAR